MYPLAYRIELYPADYTNRNGVSYNSEISDDTLESEHLIARHSGASDAQFFDWEDAINLNAHQLALLFIERFPELARATYHFDFAYVGWYATLLAHCEYGQLPYLFGEYEEEIGVMRMHIAGRITTVHKMDWFPLPPTPSGGVSMDPQPAPSWME
jgi:hypothetical protein